MSHLEKKICKLEKKVCDLLAEQQKYNSVSDMWQRLNGERFRVYDAINQLIKRQRELQK